MASVCSRICQSNTTMERNSSKIALEDCICPICMCILIEPVTMPCQHELCMPCFKQNVEEASLTCPMCRTRISVWARQAARNQNLVNQARWKQIQSLFPVRVQKRLEGKDDDSSDEVFSVPRPQLAEPGEIRREYEEQLRKVREQHEREKQREREASERLAQELQAEEARRLAEQRRTLKLVEDRDHELALDLSTAINQTGEGVSMESMGDQVRLTRSASVNSDNNNKPTSQDPATLESLLDRMRQKTQSKSGDPYPYPCLSPSDKDEATSNRTSTHVSAILGFKDSSRPETVTLSSSSSERSLQMFSPVSSVRPASQSSMRASTCTFVGEQNRLNDNSEAAQASMKYNPAKAPLILPPSRDTTLLEEILQTENPVPHSSNKETVCRKTPSGLSKGSEVAGTSALVRSKRSHSTESNDSISPEMAHFKPIQSCPRTPPRKVNGKVIEAPVIFTTPRNLSKISLKHNNSSQILDLNERSPAMHRRLRVLAEDRKRQVEANSKSTSTENGSFKKNLPVFPTIPNYCSSMLAMNRLSNSRATSTVSSETQLDVNSNESPCFSGFKPHPEKGGVYGIPRQKDVLERGNTPQIGGGDGITKPLLPLVPCMDEYDELDGLAPLPESVLQLNLYSNKESACSSNSCSPPQKSSPPLVSRNLFNSNIYNKQNLSRSQSRETRAATPLSMHKGKGKKNSKRQKTAAPQKPILSPQLSLKDMFQKAKDSNGENKKLGLSPCFASACSTPALDQVSTHMKSLISQAISSLDTADSSSISDTKDGDETILSRDFSESFDRTSTSSQHSAYEKSETDLSKHGKLQDHKSLKPNSVCVRKTSKLKLLKTSKSKRDKSLQSKGLSSNTLFSFVQVLHADKSKGDSPNNSHLTSKKRLKCDETLHTKRKDVLEQHDVYGTNSSPSGKNSLLILEENEVNRMLTPEDDDRTEGKEVSSVDNPGFCDEKVSRGFGKSDCKGSTYQEHCSSDGGKTNKSYGDSYSPKKRVKRKTSQKRNKTRKTKVVDDEYDPSYIPSDIADSETDIESSPNKRKKVKGSTRTCKNVELKGDPSYFPSDVSDIDDDLDNVKPKVKGTKTRHTSQQADDSVESDSRKHTRKNMSATESDSRERTNNRKAATEFDTSKCSRNRKTATELDSPKCTKNRKTATESDTCTPKRAQSRKAVTVTASSGESVERRTSERKRRKPVLLYESSDDECENVDRLKKAKDLGKRLQGDNDISETDKVESRSLDITVLTRPPLARFRKHKENCKAEIPASPPKTTNFRKGKSAKPISPQKICANSTATYNAVNAPQTLPHTKNSKQPSVKTRCKQSKSRTASCADYFSPTKPAARNSENRADKVMQEESDRQVAIKLQTQEELDRRVALELQKQFNREAREEREVDRRKGTSDEYSLRKKPRGLISPIASHTRKRNPNL